MSLRDQQLVAVEEQLQQVVAVIVFMFVSKIGGLLETPHLHFFKKPTIER